MTGAAGAAQGHMPEQHHTTNNLAALCNKPMVGCAGQCVQKQQWQGRMRATSRDLDQNAECAAHVAIRRVVVLVGLVDGHRRLAAVVVSVRIDVDIRVGVQVRRLTIRVHVCVAFLRGPEQRCRSASCTMSEPPQAANTVHQFSTVAGGKCPWQG